MREDIWFLYLFSAGALGGLCRVYLTASRNDLLLDGVL